MRALLICLLFPVAAIAGEGEVAFVRIWPGWRDAESFERIGEYFGREQEDARSNVLRTDPKARAGFYFLVRVRGAALAGTTRFELSVIRPDSPDPQTFSFPATLSAKEQVFQLGLTGASWPEGKKASPVAWRLALFSADGRLVAEHKSFLWAKPAP